MKNPPFFSICIPTYNRAHLLSDALDSALAQTDSDYEIVIVDNASTDNTKDVIRRYDDPRIRVICNKKTVNMFANHNICVEHACAPWVVFLHSDDRLKINALTRYREEIANNVNLDIITATCDYYQPLWESLGAEPRYKFEGNDGITLLFRYLGLNLPGLCFRRSIFSELDGFDESLVIADHDFYIRTLLAGKKITVLRNPVIEIGVNERTTNKLMETKTWLFEHGLVLAKHVSNPVIFSALAPAIQAWQPSELSRLLMFVAAGNNRITLNRYEKLDYPVVALAKKERYYLHVRLYKLLGHAGHRQCMKLMAAAQRYLRGVAKRR